MNILSLETPGLLFPAVSLLMLAYTNRFLALAALIRELDQRYRQDGDRSVLIQIGNIRRRIQMVKATQILGVGALLLCVLCMFLLFLGLEEAGKLLFALSLSAMAASLIVSVWELLISAEALSVQLSDLETDCRDCAGDEELKDRAKDRASPRGAPKSPPD